MEISEFEKQNIIRSLNEIKNGSEIIDYPKIRNYHSIHD